MMRTEQQIINKQSQNKAILPHGSLFICSHGHRAEAMPALFFGGELCSPSAANNRTENRGQEGDHQLLLPVPYFILEVLMTIKELIAYLREFEGSPNAKVILANHYARYNSGGEMIDEDEGWEDLEFTDIDWNPLKNEIVIG